jgi:hypothetical protein
MNVERETRNQTYIKHDHDNINDHNHDDTYWEHFLETKDVPTTLYRGGQWSESQHQLISEAFVPTESPTELVVNRLLNTEPPCLTSEVSEGDRINSGMLLHSNWNYYYHLPNDKNWNLASYKFIMKDINMLDKLIAVNETVTNNIIKNCMLFVMREGVTPMWEDNCNRNGGCFSYKVSNKVVVNVWRELTYLLCGNSLTIDKNHMELINGITISPKRGFCIVKIWLKNCSLQDPNIIVDVDNLIKVGCLFKTHKAEF